jgi:hypothetical protein
VQLLDESKLVSDLKKPLVPSVIFNQDNLSAPLPLEEAGYAFPDGFIRDEAYDHTNRKGEKSQTYRDAPLGSTYTLDRECDTPHKDDGSLAANHGKEYGCEKPVVSNALEEIKAIIEVAIVQSVKDLHPHKGVEDQRR